MTKEEIEKAASEISSWLQDAAGDSAGHDLESCRIMASFNDDRKEKIDNLLKNGCEPDFIPDCIADDLYDDVGWLRDLSGDRIHDEGKGDYLNMIAIAKEIRAHGHNALIKAMDICINDWEERRLKYGI